MKRLTCLLLALLSIVTVHAQIRLPALIGDHAMLQANQPVAIWGWAEPGAKVSVGFSGDAAANFTATADANGKWSGHLPALKSGATGELKISSDKGSQVTVGDILVGEVWLGGGQSNMTYDIAGKAGGDFNNPVEVAAINQNILIAQKEAVAAQPPIRYFKVEYASPDGPSDDAKGQWVVGTDKNVATFSATAWNFAVALNNKLHVPIGIIMSAIGGTPVEAWMSKETLASTSVGAAVVARHVKNLAATTPETFTKYDADLKAWEAANSTPQLKGLNWSKRPKAPYTKTANYAPSRFYDGMIHGLEPYTLRGVIWFQADGNWGNPLEYSEMFIALIKEWRAEFLNDKLPFYFVEMNNMHGDPQPKPVQPSNLSIIREQQHGALSLPLVGMVVAIDVGTPNPHFPNKKPIGERLAGLALRDCYGQTGQFNSPLYKSFSVEGNSIRLKFQDAEGLRIRGGGTDLKGFAIRGATGDWVWATGQIEGEDIVVHSDQVPAPTAVRYAWATNPVTSVENGAGLPLGPFRTDTESPQ